jgi:hypothetical protein
MSTEAEITAEVAAARVIGEAVANVVIRLIRRSVK